MKKIPLSPVTLSVGHLSGFGVPGFRIYVLYVPFVLLVFQAVNDLPQFNHRYAAKTKTNHYSKTRNPEPGTRNPEPGTRNPEPGTRNPEPGLIARSA